MLQRVYAILRKNCQNKKYCLQSGNGRKIIYYWRDI